MLGISSKTLKFKTIRFISIATLILLFLCKNILFAGQNNANSQLKVDPTLINLPKELIPKDNKILKEFSGKKYFPPKVFSRNFKVNDIQTNWISLHLIAMNEMPFWNSNNSQGIKSWCKFRFLYIPTFERPTLIRIDIIPDGRGVLTLKQTDKPGGFEIGKLKLNKTVRLSKAKVQEILTKIKEVKFWGMEIDDNYSAIDGTYWILEGVDKLQYHIVTRISPGNGEFSDLCILLSKLAGISEIR